MSDFSTTAEIVQSFFPYVEVVPIAMSRSLAIMTIMPVFTRLQIGKIAKSSIGFGFSIPVMPNILDGLKTTDPSPLWIMTISLKEAFLGLLIGVIMGLPIWSVQYTGEWIDMQRTATQDKQSDPGTGSENSTTSTLLSLIIIALFCISGGFGFFVKILSDSYVLWPPLHFLPLMHSGWGNTTLSLLDSVTKEGFRLGAPIILAMLLGDIAIILLARTAPKFQINDAAATLRNILFLLIFYLYMSWLLYDMGALLPSSSKMPGILSLLKSFLGPA